MDALTVLRESRVFRNLSPAAMAQLSMIAEERELGARVTLFNEGDGPSDRRFRCDVDTNFEHFVAAAEAEAVGERFADREVDVPCPYASFRPLPGRCAYQYQRWKFFF